MCIRDSRSACRVHGELQKSHQLSRGHAVERLLKKDTTFISLYRQTFQRSLWDSNRPVSYTHLDVYKRQVLHGAAGNLYAGKI